jgi:uncharacterized protein (TIGR03067 family)
MHGRLQIAQVEVQFRQTLKDGALPMVVNLAQVIALLCCGTPVGLDDDRKELALLQGTWMVQRIDENGGRWEKEKEQVKLTITGSQFKLEDQHKATLEGSLVVDTSQKLKTFQAVAEFTRTQKLAVAGIYKLEKDTLTFCFTKSKQRPSGFKADPGDGAILVTAKRNAESVLPH